MGASEPTCLYCGDAIHAPTEPVVVIEHDGERLTSLGREPELAERPRLLLIHASCAPAGWFEQLAAGFSAI
jgi:hypothetical protein